MDRRGITVMGIYHVQGVILAAVQTSQVKKNDIPFPVEMMKSEEEKVRFNWGVKSLPWLILTDREHVIQAEGFAFQELDDKLKVN
ncbi:MAG: hypothetical protein JXM79_21940 [Sedimentisphaerales bacterium]|nr:hypothetical protein [Sedimentisphaerales bacterium]